MVRVGVVSKSSEEAQMAATQFVEKLSGKGVDACKLIPLTNTGVGSLASCDAIFTFGGDGTILKVARMFVSSTPLIVGVNYGHLGFLAEVEPPQVDEALNKVLSGSYSFYTINRMIITIVKEGNRVKSPPIMNEVYFTSHIQGRMVTLKIEVPDLFVYKGRMDGLLVSTALGSTAYSLSAGGPIVDPASDVNIVTPMSPINIALKPFVVDRRKTINIVNIDTEPVTLIVDGARWLDLSVGDYAEISGFAYPVKLYRTRTDLLKKLFDKRLSWNHSP
ncbi:MAG: NAD(+)/NADH kinase [Thermoprotei archaeon]